MANSPARSLIDVGSVIADTYTIEALIGRGGMGSVFLASHKRLPGKKVAIKLLHAELVAEDVLLRFRREAEIASKLGHPNIVAVHDFNTTDDGTPYLVLEYLEGESLAQRIKDQGPMPVDQVMAIMRQIGGALTAAHKEGIVHRDLKPHNIFLIPTEVGDTVVEVAKVLDFGISKIRGSQTVKTQDSALLGTPQYMAPEQALGQHDKVDERTDVFALGAIAYEMLVGQPAFSGASIPEVVFKVVYEQPAAIPSTVPLPVAHAIRTAMEKGADQRYATVAAFIEAMTGTPLVSGIRPRSSGGVGATGPTSSSGQRSAPGTARSQNTGSSDAFANTVGSGDHGPTVLPVAAAAALGSAETVDSQSRAVIPAVAPHAPTAAAPLPATVPPRRPRALMFVLGVGVVAAGAVAVFFAMRSPPATPSAPPPREVVAVAPPPKVDPLPPKVETPPPKIETPPPKVETPPPKVEVKPPKVETKPPKVKPTAPTDPTDIDEPDGDDGVRQQLQKAEAALTSNNYELAHRLANAVINSSAGPRKRAEAYAIRGISECAANNNEEAARANLRALAKFPAQRARLIRVCKQHGLLQTVR